MSWARYASLQAPAPQGPSDPKAELQRNEIVALRLETRRRPPTFMPSDSDIVDITSTGCRSWLLTRYGWTNPLRDGATAFNGYFRPTFYTEVQCGFT